MELRSGETSARQLTNWNMLCRSIMWSERGKCGGKVQNIKGNALGTDFAQNLLRICHLFVENLPLI